MPIADDWFIDYVDEVFYHIDGRLSYDTNIGTAPDFGDFVRGTTSGAVGKVVAGSDLGGVAASGTLDLSRVVGVFQNNEPLRVLSQVPFDTVAGTPQGFRVGDTLTGPTTESIDCRAIEYNQGYPTTAALAGEGIIHGDGLTAGFADNEVIDVSGGATAVALVNGTEADHSGLFATCLVNGTLAVPGTANTNKSEIIHYDAGSQLVPEDATVSDTVTGANGIVARVYGDATTGSIRIVDGDTSGGAWTDNNGLDVDLVVNYDLQVAGQVFQVGDIIRGATSGATARILLIIDDGDSTGRLITADSSGTWDAVTPDDIEVTRRGGLPVTPVKIAEVENTTFTLAVATLNLPGGTYATQRQSEGGVYADGDGINIVRKFNALYTHIVDTFDELLQMDDDYPIRGDVKDGVYVGQGGWQIDDGSLPYLESGSWADQTADNVWTNFQSGLVAADIGNHGFFVSTTNTRPQPSLYAEQIISPSGVGEEVTQFWLPGEVDVLIKTKTKTNVEVIDTTVEALGQLINGGVVTWNLRPYGRTYDQVEQIGTASVSIVSMSNQADANNTTGEYLIDYDAGSAATLLVGEEITTGSHDLNTLKVGIVTAQTGDAGATGTVSYVLVDGAQFADNEVLTGAVSGKTLTVNEPVSIGNLVAGYGSDVGLNVVTRRMTGGTTTVASFILGERVSQAVSLADGFFLEDDGGTIYLEEESGSAAFNATGQLSGDTSGALNTPTGTAAFATVPKDINDGAGDQNYDGTVSGNITGGGSPRLIQDVYEWTKFITSRTAVASRKNFATPGVDGTDPDNRVPGKFFRRLEATFAEIVKIGAPTGSKPGAVLNFAQGWFPDSATYDTADLQNFSAIDNAGVARTPPNLQALAITGLVTPDTAAAYRATGAAGGGSTTILRTEFDVGTVGAGNNQAADSTILVGAATRSVGPLPQDVPDAAILRIEDPNNPGTWLRFIYDQVNRSTNVFTLQSGIGQDTIGDVTSATDLILDDDVFLELIGEDASGASASNTIEFVASFPIVVVVREKGIKPFRAAADFTATGASVGAIRDPDPVVNLP